MVKGAIVVVEGFHQRYSAAEALDLNICQQTRTKDAHKKGPGQPQVQTLG